MILNDKDLKFLQQRRKLHNYWWVLGVLVSTVFLCIFVVLFIRVPLIINPYHTAEVLEAGELDITTLNFFALICPLSFLFLFIGLLTMVQLL